MTQILLQSLITKLFFFLQRYLLSSTALIIPFNTTFIWALHLWFVRIHKFQSVLHLQLFLTLYCSCSCVIFFSCIHMHPRCHWAMCKDQWCDGGGWSLTLGPGGGGALYVHQTIHLSILRKNIHGQLQLQSPPAVPPSSYWRGPSVWDATGSDALTSLLH